jgi:hypothetical protein
MEDEIIDVDQAYAACLDSVQVIEEGPQADDPGRIQRNVDHLNIMLAKDFWGPEHDLAVLQDAVNSV